MFVAYFILGLYALGALAAIIGLIYLIRRRLKIRKEETFENRSN